MENQLFRQKSLDRISSPEELHDYMRVTSPRLWMVLAAIIILLAGFIVYASTAQMESTLAINLKVTDYGYITAVLPSSGQKNVTAEMKVRMADGQTGSVSSISQSLQYRLVIRFDGDSIPENATYIICQEGADPSDDGTSYMIAACTDGTVMVDSLMMASEWLENLRSSTDIHVRFWTEDFTGDEIIFRPGRLATISGMESVVTTMVTVTMDDPDAIPEPGVYPAEIITESTRPISFLWN